jgi:ankyrin repeat protein
LFIASFHNCADVAQLLLDYGASIEHHNRHGPTALHVASAKNSVDVVELLLNRGANMEHQSRNGGTPLLLAAVHKSDDMVRLLLDRNANNTASKQEWSYRTAPGVHPSKMLMLFNCY